MPLDAFLMFTGPGPAGEKIEGETKDKQMLKECASPPFDIANWSFAITQEVSVGSAAGGMGAGKVTFEQFKITKNIDKSSPFFFKTCVTGGHYQDCSLMIRKAGATKGQSGAIYLRFNFKMVFVSNLSWSHADPSPTEDITFDYGAMEVNYAPQNADGTLKEFKTQAWSRVLNNSTFGIAGGS